MAVKRFYICSECGHKASRWTGQCPMCKSWDTMEEQEARPEIKTASKLIVNAIKAPETIPGVN